MSVCGKSKGYQVLVHNSRCVPCRADAWEAHDGSSGRAIDPPVPGGYVSDNFDDQDRFQRNFDSDMYAFREAVRHGVEPEATTKVAVEREYKRLYAVERLEKSGALEVTDG